MDVRSWYSGYPQKVSERAIKPASIYCWGCGTQLIQNGIFTWCPERECPRFALVVATGRRAPDKLENTNEDNS